MGALFSYCCFFFCSCFCPLWKQVVCAARSLLIPSCCATCPAKLWLYFAISFFSEQPIPSQSSLTCPGKELGDEVGLVVSVMLLSRIGMLSTAQQMLQDSRSKIELIRLQIIKVTQAGSSGSGVISDDGSDDHNSSTHTGQDPGPRQPHC